MADTNAPKHIWISNASLPQSLKDGVGEYFIFPGDGGKFDLLEYVPKAEIVARDGLITDLLEALEWLDALFEAGDFRADHKAEALTIRRKVKAVIRKAKSLEATRTADKGNSK